ncbi:MAG: c-type cytochrome [Zoogloea sp.]|uniref:c-type cytochrome n=1 Tax=Zoogloea sp. TaxID=49181 RepID=UPI003F3D82EE
MKNIHPLAQLSRTWRLFLLFASLATALPAAAELPALPEVVRENPYRQNPEAIALGRSLFNQNCARCHGADAINQGQVGPDLTKLERACLSLQVPEQKQQCLRDNDHFFFQSVQEGKRRVGVEHMPPWAGVLNPQQIWAIRSFVESRRNAPPSSAQGDKGVRQ